MQPEVQLRDNAKVATAATNRPVQVFIPARSQFVHFTVHCHELCPDQIVRCRSVQASPARITARKRQAGNSYRAARPHGRIKPLFKRGAEEIPDSGTSTHRSDLAIAIDRYPAQRAEVDLQRAIGHPVTGIAMTTAADRDWNRVLPRELHTTSHVVNVRDAHHRERMT